MKKMFKKKFFIVAFILSLCITVGCSSDDDNSSTPGGGSGDFGSIQLSVSGDVEGEFSGMADFYGDDSSYLDYWEISGHNFNPQTFSFNLSRHGQDASERPQEGTYSISGVGLGDNEFSAEFIYIENENFTNAQEYSSFYGGDGEVIIQQSTSSVVKGTLHITLEKDEEDMQSGQTGKIELEGSFEAHPRIFAN